MSDITDYEDARAAAEYERGRADERERCRAELREKVDALVALNWNHYDAEARYDELVRWAGEEAFGGE